MYRLSSIILTCLVITTGYAQSPHGEKLKINCAECHNSSGWNVSIGEISFDHDQTDFELEGIHELTDCKLCHSTLVFDEAPSDCFSCHEDVHSQTVGNDCARCHTSQSWLVDVIPELHEENGFALIGSHSSISCVECHAGETNLRFDRLGNECANCHLDDYQNTQNPNHVTAGYSTQCDDCHNPFGFSWGAEGLSHDFFPLEGGHDIQDCAQCHDINDYSNIDPDCASCHLQDYNQTSDPDHQALGFPTDCAVCHGLEPDWSPARYDDHDAQFFPIFSGKHNGTWDSCTDCHNNPGNFSEFTCFTCHLKNQTDNDHSEVNGYVYESNACLQCHPDGDD